MYASVKSAGVRGLSAELVTVEVDLSSGLPRFDLVGLPNSAVSESKERVRSAVRNCGFQFPISRITVNLAPADFRKEGPIYDLPIFTAMTKLDKRYIEASHDLGCNGFQTMTRVIMPLTVSGVISGITMVFVPSISTFYISQKLGAGKIDLIGDTIERLFQNTSTYNVGAVISLVMMILILISVWIMNKFSDDEGGVII